MREVFDQPEMTATAQNTHMQAMAKLSTHAVAESRGKYRINAVSEMTGVPAATLRAWERRYGLPEPRRTESSYRVYSDRDVALIRRVRELCDGGLAPSEAAKVVLAETEAEATPANSPDPHAAAAEAIVEAVAAFEPAQVESAVRHAMALGPATAVFDRVLAPAMVEIGQRWHDGKLSIAQEHLATSVMEGAASTMLRLVQPEHADRMAIVACFADETHSLPPLGFALHLSAWGFRVVRLGARTPPGAIAHAVRELSPNLVALSVTVEPAAHRVRELVEEYAIACRGVPWIVGGSGTPSMADLITARGGEVVADYDPRKLKSFVDAMVARSRRQA